MSDLPPPSGSATSLPPPSEPAPTGSTRFGILAAALLFAGVFGVLVFALGDRDENDSVVDGAVVTTAPTGTEAVESAATIAPSETVPLATSVISEAAPVGVSTTLPQSTTEQEADAAAVETAASSTEPAPVETESVESAPQATVEPSDDAEVPTTEASAAPPDEPDYPVLSDGTPRPIEVVYDGAAVTLTGLVPSEEARQTLEVLAVAGAPQPDTIAENLLEINENVPITVGARVLSLDSVRFPEGSSEVTPEHAAELDGSVRTLEALPNTTMLVIGHADQRGDDLENLALSQDRADAILFYLVSQGIDPSRLSSRAVGESNPISEANSDAGLELNRRTELIFYGLLVA